MFIHLITLFLSGIYILADITMTSGRHLFEYLGLRNSVKFAHMQMLRKEYYDFLGCWNVPVMASWCLGLRVITI